jgi:hypothetical protein
LSAQQLRDEPPWKLFQYASEIFSEDELNQVMDIRVFLQEKKEKAEAEAAEAAEAEAAAKAKAEAEAAEKAKAEAEAAAKAEAEAAAKASPAVPQLTVPMLATYDTSMSRTSYQKLRV